ncbi:hypothetical protein IC220_00285 [Wolbachia endosymbiont of Pentalonia nigronervosa]|jgi:hypothetical protein|uniref:hypothetical protein n=1 Tax=Wolbachia endosymbiont of Pentalonia nigronervosa TaxID=1301914 RepID=UPI00165EF7BB|nr:hypothetical protein [Wolbachia endosymbiont of Pentalonia nigronervosa]MBD0390914.1 hypothetical protein [Wolbachia endosymbiont of Pentalonia nigronervosa]
MLRAVLNKIFGNASEEPANPVQTTEQERVEVDANVVVSAEETTEQNSEEEFVEVNSEDVVNYADEAMEQALSESGVVSYVIRPSLYAAKYGAQALYATALVMGYTLEGISYCMAGASHVPYEISKLLEKHKEQNKETAGYQNTAGYKVTVFSMNALGCTSSAVHILSYMPYCAGKVLLQVAYASDGASKCLSPEKIEEICDYANSFSQEKPGSLEEINVNSGAAQAAAIAA